jgi:hypothetical protein
LIKKQNYGIKSVADVVIHMLLETINEDAGTRIK